MKNGNEVKDIKDTTETDSNISNKGIDSNFSNKGIDSNFSNKGKNEIDIHKGLDSLVKVLIFICLFASSLHLKDINTSLANLSLQIPTNETGGNANNGENPDMSEFMEISKAVLSSEYAQSHSLDTSNMTMPDMFSLSENEYFVFFYMDGCDYCHMTMPTLQEYINLNMTDNADLFFAEISGGEGFWSTDGKDTEVTPETFKVVGTPTMLHVKDGQAEAVVGPEAIAQMLGL